MMKRFFILITALLLSIGSSSAECWVNTTPENEKIPVYLDIDSVRTKGENTYFNVMYYTPSQSTEVIYMIQMRGGATAVIKSCTVDEYLANRLPMNTLLGFSAKSFEPITLHSPIYGAYKMVILSEAEREKLRKQGLELNDQKEPDFSHYVTYVQRRVKYHWKPARLSQKYSVTVKFEIAKDGSLVSCEVIESSGMRAADAEAILAVKTAAPFRALPKEFMGDKIEIKYTLNYEMFYGLNQR